MARTTQALFACDTTASAGNLNGGAFNPYNANFPTDLATTTGTSAAPTVSAAYAFQNATDANAWVYVKSGTNWIQGFYKITSVSGGVATLNATIGAAVVWDATTGQWLPSTVQGCATQNTPGGNATYGVDYSQTAAAPWAGVTDLSTAAGTTNPSAVSSATVGFGTNHLGNFIHVTAGTNWTVNGTSTTGLQSWYEIVSVAAGVATLSDNQAVGTAADLTVNKGTFYLGGALSLGSSTANRTDDGVFEMGGGVNGSTGTIFFIKSGTFASLPSVTLAAIGGTQAPSKVIGFNAVRGDISVTPTLTRPILNTTSGGGYVGAPNWDWYHLDFTGTGTGVITTSSNNKIVNIRAYNTSATAARAAMTTTLTVVINCEAKSLRGYALTHSSGSTTHVMYSYFHDSDVGIRSANTGGYALILGCIVENCVTACIDFASVASGQIGIIAGNTLYGAENKWAVGSAVGCGIRFNITATRNDFLMNNIFYGFITGITHVDTQTVGLDNWNDYYNNTNDVSSATQWQKGNQDLALNPSFTSVSQVTGTAGAFVAGNNKLVDTTKNFTSLGVVAGDHVLITGGTGAPTLFPFLIDSISTTTNTNDTLNITVPAGPGTSTVTDKTYQITTGHNFAIGTNLKAVGFPGAFQGGFTTSALDIGAVQRVEAGGSSTGVSRSRFQRRM